VPCGTTGESPTLSDEEQREVIARAIELGHQAADLQVIAGAGSNNTAHAVEMHLYAKSVGADASLQVSPYYNKPSQGGPCTATSRRSPTAATCQSCSTTFPGAAASRSRPRRSRGWARHPNIKAIKEATGSMDSASEICAALRDHDSLGRRFADALVRRVRQQGRRQRRQ
jgi:4-hydroxy-tetrahydrodipicolinate synthase